MTSSGELAGILAAVVGVTLTAAFSVAGYYFRRIEKRITKFDETLHRIDTRVTVNETRIEDIPQVKRQIGSGAEIMAGLTTEVSNHLRWHERHDTRGG